MGNISIEIKGFSTVTSSKIVASLNKIYKDFSFLDIRRLSTIIVSSEFKENSVTLQDKYAVVLTLSKNDDFEFILLINPNFILNILKNKEDLFYKRAFHILHHEFAHIHDNNKKIDAFKNLMKTSSYKGVSSLLYPIAENCWSEYIANFISSKSALDTTYPFEVAKALLYKVNNIPKEIEKKFSLFNGKKGNKEFILFSIKQAESLFKSAAYLIGYLNGIGISLEKIDEKIALELNSSSFYIFFESLKYELSSIHQIYPDGFINLSIYKKIAFLVEEFLKQKGISLIEEKEEPIF
ncbi:hypothetical protein [Halarcobacter anaerophilus]|uniref:Uncharacterized protein n=1 Tax=Halarcobacter anaerophilus TaxID=877500 RepID=A0A4Q0Y153_9BACT|nr:hypothetical protein [Halarcobacter anaerophilus]QDF29094.1 hypothetical protein AANAER_1618 [Halarcobacter anaerophilus]RXJ63722.1 hypothetical protein CRV06_05915 [Halarcobacter anaerophilus]